MLEPWYGYLMLTALLAGVELKSGKKLEAGLVVVGVGAIPNTEMFKGQLDLLEDKPGGVKVPLRPCCNALLGLCPSFSG